MSIGRVIALVIGFVGAGTVAVAQDVGTVAVALDVGTVAAVSGSAEITRAGTPTGATVGAGVRIGDQLRAEAGKMRVVFQDDSVIDLAERSTLIVSEQLFEPEGGQVSTLINLLVGKARAVVSHYYGAAGASYQVQTPTAVAGVRGTEFVISYDPDTDVSAVVGIHGFVQVRNLTADADQFIYVGAEETTTVQRDQAPTSPRRIDERLFRDEVEGMELLSLGGAAGSALRAASIAPPEQAPLGTGQVGQLGRDQLRNTGDVVGQPLNVLSERGRLGVPF